MVQIQAARCASSRARAPRASRPAPHKSSLLLFLTAALASGCASPLPVPFAGADPVDPSAPAPRTDYQSTIGGYSAQRPVDPVPWQERNQRVAPAPKG